jgi:nitrilase
VKCAVIQMNSVSDKRANLAEAARLIDEAVARERPDWVLLPEHFEWAGGSSADKLAIAEPLVAGSATYDLCAGLAARHGIFLHAGSVYEKLHGEARVHNASIVFDRQGRDIACYRKIHLFDITTPGGTAYLESATIRPGREIVTYDADGLRVGCTICYDLRFPELFQALVRAGAEMIAVPSSFALETGKDHWEVLLRARAIETQAYVLAAAQHGRFETPAGPRLTYGHSLVVDPWGHVIARASDGSGHATARVEPGRVAALRARMPLAAHRAAREITP